MKTSILNSILNSRPFYFIALLIMFSATLSAQPKVLLHQGHAHNDYKHKRPLLDALENGFTSIEIDVYSFEGKIKVSHLNTVLKRKPEFASLYLEPLKALIENNNGLVFPGDSTQLILMIDLKSDKRELVGLLQEAFMHYTHLVQPINSQAWAPLKVVLSGRPPVDLLLKDDNKIFRMEGSVVYNTVEYPADIMPRLGSGYKSNFVWTGRGKFPENERQKLSEFVRRANSKGQKVRFWASPDKKAVWKALLDEGVHWINVDDLEGFRDFYLDYQSGHQ